MLNLELTGSQMCSTFHFGAIANYGILTFTQNINLTKYEPKKNIGCHDSMSIIYVL